MESKKLINPGRWYTEYDENGNLIKAFYDTSYKRLLGYKTDEEFENAHSDWFASLHPDDRPYINEAYVETVKKHPEGYDYDIEYRMMTKNGYRWFHDYGHCTRGPDGSLIRCDGVLFDIHDIKSMNMNLGSIALSHDVLSNSNIGMWAVEMDPGKEPRLYCDEAMMKLIGIDGLNVTPEEANLALEGGMDEGHRDEIKTALAKMGQGFHAEVQYPWHYKDGRTIIVRCGGTRNFKYTKGIRIEGVHRDVTDLSHFELEQQLKAKIHESEILTESFLNNFTLVYRVNLKEDTYTILQNKREDSQIGDKYKTFSEALQDFLKLTVYEKDQKHILKEIDYDNIRKKLKNNVRFVVDYRVKQGDDEVWHELTVHALEGDDVVFGFSQKNMEIIERGLQEKINNDYYALYSVDVDTLRLTVLKNPEWYDVGKPGETVDYFDVIQKFCDNSDGETETFFESLKNVEYLKTQMAKEDKHTYSFKSKLLDGKHWVSVTSYVVIRNEDGSPAVFTLGFSFLDSFSADRHELTQKITHQTLLLDYFISSSSSAYSVNLADDSFEILHMDKSVEKWISKDGTKKDMDNFIENHIHPEDKSIMLQYTDRKNLIKKLKKQSHLTFKIREIFGDVIKTMRVLVVRGIDEYHVVIGFLDITDDLKKQQEQQNQLKEALSQAQAANRSKTTFLNSMSHDIRTPMNAIIGFTNLAVNHINDKDMVQDYLTKIGQASDHLLSLINDVLDMSRIESGNVNIKNDHQNLSAIISSTVNMIQTDCQLKEIDFKVQTDNIADTYVLCDKLRLNQVLINVLSNAIKYTQRGGKICMKIEERPSEKEGFAQYEFCVKDNGMGMDKEFLKKIFEPFTRVQSSTVSGIQGTGLGMSITKKIIDMMGGTINIKSKPGKGTEVIITFDFELEGNGLCEVEEDVIHNLAPVLPDLKDFKGKKILLVEDNPFNREIATIVLEEAGFVIDHAEDGSIAIEKMKTAKAGDYDLILMDIQMPKVDGYEATRQIRAMNNEVSKIPIIAMTANAFEEDRKQAMDVGMNEHVAKPVDLDKLYKVLTKICK